MFCSPAAWVHTLASSSTGSWVALQSHFSCSQLTPRLHPSEEVLLRGGGRVLECVPRLRGQYSWPAPTQGRDPGNKSPLAESNTDTGQSPLHP